ARAARAGSRRRTHGRAVAAGLSEAAGRAAAGGAEPGAQGRRLGRAGGEQVVELERGVDRRCVVVAVATPLRERPVPGELEVVAVGIAEVDGEVRAVIRELPQRDAGVDEPADDLGEALAR